MATRLLTAFSLGAFARASLPQAATTRASHCVAGTGRCSAGIGEESGDGLWARLTAILANRKSDIDSYTSRFASNETVVVAERDTTDEYYDLATDFYEYGWGSSFHFATRFRGESLAASILRHEHFLAMKLGLKPGHEVADLGMGIGGPLRAIAKFSGASITGVSINDYQVRRAKKLTRERESAVTASRMRYVHGDFTRLVPQVFAAESLDAAYYIESACHISNRTEIFSEAARALKKGGRLFSYEWVLTEKFDASNPEHLDMKKGVEFGNGIENLVSHRVPLEALERSGFRIVEHGDLVDLAEEWYGEDNVPWYHDLAQAWSFSSIGEFQKSHLGQRVLSRVLEFVQTLGLVPPGAVQTNEMLAHGGRSLVAGGIAKTFTPMYYVVAEKL